MKFNVNEDYRVKWYPKQHVSAADLGDGKGNYKPVTVEIASIKVEMLMKQKSQKKEETPIAVFKKGSKYLILSNAVCKGLHEATGSAIPKDWLNVPIELYVETGVKAFGKTSDQVRVRRAKGFRPNPQLANASPISPEEQAEIDSFEPPPDDDGVDEDFHDSDEDLVVGTEDEGEYLDVLAEEQAAAEENQGE